MGQILLSRGMEAIVDDEDIEKTSGYNWIVGGSGTRHHPYVATAIKEEGKINGKRIQKRVYLHQLILGNPSYPIRHRNGNGLDNRKENLIRRGFHEMATIPKDVELAYFAGIVDGEGCISSAETRGRVFASLNVTNTYPYILEDLKSLFGGNIYRRNRKKALEHHKASYGWTIGGASVSQALELLLPYMIIKKEQAKVAMELCRLQEFKDEVSLEKRQELRNMLKQLNHKTYDEYDVGERVWL